MTSVNIKIQKICVIVHKQINFITELSKINAHSLFGSIRLIRGLISEDASR
jgi:hypothetical protein